MLCCCKPLAQNRCFLDVKTRWSHGFRDSPIPSNMFGFKKSRECDCQYYLKLLTAEDKTCSTWPKPVLAQDHLTKNSDSWSSLFFGPVSKRSRGRRCAACTLGGRSAPCSCAPPCGTERSSEPGMSRRRCGCCSQPAQIRDCLHPPESSREKKKGNRKKLEPSSEHAIEKYC